MSQRVSLRGLLGGLAFAGMAISVIASALVLNMAWQARQEADRIAQVFDRAADAVNSLTLATSDMERGLSLYTLSDDEQSLVPYVNGERRSAIALTTLNELLSREPALADLMRSVTDSRQAWLTGVALPIRQAIRAGDPAGAKKLLTDDQGQLLFDRFVTDSDRLDNVINGERVEAAAHLGELTDRLVLLLLGAVGMLITGVLGAAFIMFRWVLRPLENLRMQMQQVTRDHNQSLHPSGPTEIRAVGSDAEHMRRELVEQIDSTHRATATARRAHQSLASGATVVKAIMWELGTRTDSRVPGLRIHGEVEAAETVLAGDFWDCVAMPDGSAGLVIADLAGHGDTIGVAALRIKHLLSVALASGRDPNEALQIADRRLADENEPTATAAIVVVNPDTGRIRWANAGHHPPVLVSSEGGHRLLQRTGPLLSWLGGPWRVEETVMGPRDLLLIYSDGLVESHDGAGTELGLPGLLEVAEQARGEVGDSDVAALVRRTLALARERATDWERDDVTFVAVSLAGAHLPAQR